MSACKSDMAHWPTCVYRAYIGDTLAYIGVTKNPAGRFAKHGCKKTWWRSVTHIALTWYETRAEALEAEADAIHAERPEFNVWRPKWEVVSP